MLQNQNDLDDFNDASRPPLTDWVEMALQWIFATAGISMMLYVCRLVLEALWR